MVSCTAQVQVGQAVSSLELWACPVGLGAPERRERGELGSQALPRVRTGHQPLLPWATLLPGQQGQSSTVCVSEAFTSQNYVINPTRRTGDCSD